MLTTLSVTHFTIVDELLLDFGSGMSVFTGETGAGKSITLDALSLALGARGDKTVVRTGCEQCDVSAVFHIDNNPLVLSWLAEQACETENELTLRRVITRAGRSKSFINGVLFPLQKTRELGELLINIHGQHQQYYLLNHDNHRNQLDAFAMCENVVNDVGKNYANYQDIEKTIQSLRQSKDKESRVELLHYQVRELNDLSVTENEVETLSAEYKLLTQQKQFIESTESIVQRLENEDGNSLTQQIHGVLQLSLDMAHPGLNCFNELMNNAHIHCQEAYAEISDFQRQLEQNPVRLEVLEKRLETIFNIARKHHVKPEELFELTNTLTEELRELLESDTRVEMLTVALKEADEKTRKISEILHKKRKKEASQLSKKITETIRTLGMPNGEVEVRVEKQDKLSPHGLDRVEYYVCLNKGIEARPLSKIASGGELSRISLAIQVLTAEKKAYPTLIFDEVDTGIGGVQAAKVGQLLRRLGDHTQVLCVTHQAQVASNANCHYLVVKETKKKQTYLKMNILKQEEKVNELARMLSGVEVTKQTVAHAKELLEQAIG